MAPDADNCEQAERLNTEDCRPPTHPGRRILPEEARPAQAWIENEEERTGGSQSNSPGECRRLLRPSEIRPLKPKPKSLQAGLTLGVWEVSKKQTKSSVTSKAGKLNLKTTFQKRKKALIALLKPPYFILSMIIIIAVIHACGNAELRSQLEWAPGPWWREPWRLLTYGCLHATMGHLVLNCLVALSVGWSLEREQGWWRVVTVWLGGVCAGALGAGALQPHVRVVGASAAIYALLTAHLPNVCLRRGHIPLWWFRPLSVIVLGTSEGTWAFLRTRWGSLASVSPGNDNVAWAAHALGAAVGVPIAFIMFTGENRSERYIFVCRVISMAVLLGGVVAATVYYSTYYDIEK